MEALHFKGDDSTACRPSAILSEGVLGRHFRKAAAHSLYCYSFLALAYALEHLPVATACLHRSSIHIDAIILSHSLPISRPRCKQC